MLQSYAKKAVTLKLENSLSRRIDSQKISLCSLYRNSWLQVTFDLLHLGKSASFCHSVHRCFSRYTLDGKIRVLKDFQIRE
jgi:hypothetical protein